MFLLAASISNLLPHRSCTSGLPLGAVVIFMPAALIGQETKFLVYRSAAQLIDGDGHQLAENAAKQPVLKDKRHRSRSGASHLALLPAMDSKTDVLNIEQL